ncbi:unnamed protein product, partial [Prorocentrum cordatum]
MPSAALDRWGNHDAMPQWTIPRAHKAKDQPTAADGIDPCTYRTERDFPLSRDELPKGMLTGSASSPSFTFSWGSRFPSDGPPDARRDAGHGARRQAARHEGTNLPGVPGPGQYRRRAAEPPEPQEDPVAAVHRAEGRKGHA